VTLPKKAKLLLIDKHRIMKKQLEQRLLELKKEFESGQEMLKDLEAKQANLRETLLRISGAIQVIEEELGKVPFENGREPEPADNAPEIKK
jgi:predicted nuclease with TOPRIM domain